MDLDTHVSYILKVIYEIRARKATIQAEGPVPEVDTIYIGGGTPSLLEAECVTELLDAVYSAFRVDDGAEITIEVNPGTADVGKFREYFAAGVNRVSIGAQSFSKDTLAFLGRIHGAADIVKCFVDARSTGFDNIGLDLIFGVPGQKWDADLMAAAELKPDHLSYYGLQIEEGTPLYEDYLRDDFETVDEVEDRRMYHFAKEYLAGQGLNQYEISNSARPGYESRHNLKYWSMEPYIGFGVGAHSYCGGQRFSNKPDLDAYIAAENESDMTAWTHKNTLSDDMSEYIFLGLRRTAGIELERFRAEFDRDFWELFGEETEGLIGRGLLERSGGTLRLTSLGLDLANTVFAEYV